MKKEGNGVYWFEDPGSFSIHTHATLNESWVFDTTNMITAQITALEEMSFLGLIDSVKTINLSNGTNFQLSKNFGLLSFPDFYDTGSYQLAGIEGLDLGEVVPDFWDYYNFDVGDIFFYEINEFESSTFFHKIEKVTVLTKEIVGDSFVYLNRRLNYLDGSDYYNGNWSSSYIDTFQSVFANGQSDFTNRFSGELIQVEVIGLDHLNRLNIYKNDNEEIVKEVGVPIYPYSAFNLVVGTDTLLQSPGGYYQKFKPGLGKIFHYISWFDSYESVELIGYIKGLDTVGTVYSDEELTVSLSKPLELEQNLKLFPNPSHDYFSITFDEPAKELYKIELIDINGAVLYRAEFPKGKRSSKFDISNVSKGIYFVKVQGASGVKTIRIIKENDG